MSDLERDIYEVSNQLGGYVGPGTEERLAKFLIRESKEAAKLADEIERLQRDMKGLGTLATLVYRRFYQGNPGWENWRAALNGKDLIDQIELMTRPEIMENSDTAGMNHIHRSIILGEKQR